MLRYADRVKERGVDGGGGTGGEEANQGEEQKQQMQQMQMQELRGVNMKNLDGRLGTAPSSRGGERGGNLGRRSLDAGIGGLGRSR